ncbi:hypothetical protein D049_1411B, partial [Vibrio parahaemolyticus VPTS-2010]
LLPNTANNTVSAGHK